MKTIKAIWKRIIGFLLNAFKAVSPEMKDAVVKCEQSFEKAKEEKAKTEEILSASVIFDRIVAMGNVCHPALEEIKAAYAKQDKAALLRIESQLKDGTYVAPVAKQTGSKKAKQKSALNMPRGMRKPQPKTAA